MGLLDDIKALAGGGNAQKMLGAAQNLLESNGGLDGLVGRFRESGLGDVADSWVGTGENRAVSEEQVRQALGDERIDQVARDADVSHDEALAGLTKFLPNIVDHLTPDGKIPDMGEVSRALGDLDLGALRKLVT